MKCKLLMVLSLLMFLGLTGIAIAEPDPGNRDTLTFVSTTCPPAASSGQKDTMEIYFYNDEELGAIQVPFKWSSSDITVDSVSFVGSRVNYLAMKGFQIFNDSLTATSFVTVFFESAIPAGSGMYGRIYFNIPEGTPDQIVTVDSITTGINVTPGFFTTGGLEYDLPVVNSGTLTIGGGSADGDQPVMPTVNSLSQNYPNPFNPVTKINFSLERKSHVKLIVYNVLAQEIATLADGEFEAGLHTEEWDGKDVNGRVVASGVYFYKLITDGFSEARRMVFMK